MSNAVIRCGPVKNGMRMKGKKNCTKKCPLWSRCMRELGKQEIQNPHFLIDEILKNEN